MAGSQNENRGAALAATSTTSSPTEEPGTGSRAAPPEKRARDPGTVSRQRPDVAICV